MPRPGRTSWSGRRTPPTSTRSTNPDAAALIDQAARAVKAPILVGALLDGPGDHVRNAGIVWDPRTGPGQTYLKRHPVPFGEYIPLRSIARLVTKKVDLVGRDMIAGKTVGALQLGGTTVGDVICFEVAEDGLVRDTVDHGAKLLLVQTNNATFGRSGEAPQQFAMARIRAVEHSRTALVASTTGISGMIAPDGTVLVHSSIFTKASYDRAVPVSTATTLADRVGSVPEWLLTGIGVASLAFCWYRRRRSVPGPDAAVTPAGRSEEDGGSHQEEPEPSTAGSTAAGTSATRATVTRSTATRRTVTRKAT